MFGAIISRRLLARFATESNRVVLPDLKYGYSSLEPVISSKMLETHHKKHHQTYVNNLNAALDQFEGTSPSYTDAKANFDYNRIASLCQTIKFNLGGHINHSIYWENLAPIGQGGGEYPPESSPFTQQVIKQFHSYEQLIDEFTKRTVPIQGSGWGWLGYDNASRSLRILEMANQEMLAPIGLTPLLSIEVSIQRLMSGNMPTTSTTRTSAWTTSNRFGRS